MTLSIVIPSFNTKKLLLGCIGSIIEKTKGIDYEIIVVDNASTDGSAASVRGIANVKLIENKKNLGFAAGNNQGWRAAKGKYILFLNSDTEINKNIFPEMVAWMDKHPKAGVATCALRSKDGSLQGTGGYFPTLIRLLSWMTIQDIPYVDSIIKPFHPFHGKSFAKGADFYKSQRELDWVTGAYLFTRREILEKVGGWDEDYFMYVEEVDLCFRIKKEGWQVWYLPQWSITHYGGASSSQEFSVLSEFAGIKRFYRKFYPAWQYPIARALLKLGALGRIVLFGILEGEKGRKVYAEAFREA